METLTKEQELYLVYEYLLEAYETVSSDKTLEKFVESAYVDLSEFEENYPEIVSEYQFKYKTVHNSNKDNKCK